MAASLIIGNPYDLTPNIFGSQMDAPRQKVRLTLGGGQIAGQPGAPTPTTLLLGSCLGIASASGKAVLVNSAATDGSQTLAAVLAHDTETGNGDVIAVAYLTGSFLASRLLFGGTDTVATHFSRFYDLTPQYLVRYSPN